MRRILRRSLASVLVLPVLLLMVVNGLRSTILWLQRRKK